MEVPLPWERLLWSGRSAYAPRTRYVLTDFRLVRLSSHEADELAIQDIADIQRRIARLGSTRRDVRIGEVGATNRTRPA